MKKCYVASEPMIREIERALTCSNSVFMGTAGEFILKILSRRMSTIVTYDKQETLLVLVAIAESKLQSRFPVMGKRLVDAMRGDVYEVR